MRGTCALNSPKDVVLLKIPYPNEESALNKIPHMYICFDIDGETAKFLKCQSYKPYHDLKNSPPINRVIEDANPTRNPFKRKTLIDLDKVFVTDKVRCLDTMGKIDDALLKELVEATNTATAETISLEQI